MSSVLSKEKNVLGGPLLACSYDPLTGFFRDGCCATHDVDGVAHLVCIKTTAEFLEFSRSRGNDLSTPRPEMRFKGLQPGIEINLKGSARDYQRVETALIGLAKTASVIITGKTKDSPAASRSIPGIPVPATRFNNSNNLSSTSREQILD